MAKRSEFAEAEANVQARPAAVLKCSCGRDAEYDVNDHGTHRFMCEGHFHAYAQCVCSPVRASFLTPERRIVW